MHIVRVHRCRILHTYMHTRVHKGYIYGCTYTRFMYKKLVLIGALKMLQPLRDFLSVDRFVRVNHSTLYST